MKLKFVSDLKIVDTKCKFVLENLDEEFLKHNYVDRIIKLIKEKVNEQYYGGKEKRDLVWASKEKEVFNTEDPAVQLEKLGWIKRAPGKGQWIYGPRYTALHNTFRELYKKYIFDKLGFHEMIFPKFEPWRIPERSGHAKNIYPFAYFVLVPSNSDPEYWEDVLDYF